MAANLIRAFKCCQATRCTVRGGCPASGTLPGRLVPRRRVLLAPGRQRRAELATFSCDVPSRHPGLQFLRVRTGFRPSGVRYAAQLAMTCRAAGGAIGVGLLAPRQVVELRADPLGELLEPARDALLEIRDGPLDLFAVGRHRLLEALHGWRRQDLADGVGDLRALVTKRAPPAKKSQCIIPATARALARNRKPAPAPAGLPGRDLRGRPHAARR